MDWKNKGRQQVKTKTNPTAKTQLEQATTDFERACNDLKSLKDKLGEAKKQAAFLQGAIHATSQRVRATGKRLNRTREDLVSQV